MMKAISFFFSLLISFSVLSSESIDCSQAPIKSYIPKYAKKFRIDYFKSFKIVHVENESYLLSSDREICGRSFQAKIQTPVSRVAFMSTTYLPALQILKQEKSLIAFQGKKYIVSEAFNKNSLRDLSFKFNPEDLRTIQADLIMGYSSNLSDLKQNKLFKKLSLPVVINKDFEEESPLARAEWLIFISAFYNLEERALSVFNEIESNYRSLKFRNAGLEKASVLIGSIENGSWITCGGRSDLAQLIQDAGGNLAFKSNSTQTQSLSLELLLKSNKSYDVWLTHNNWKSSGDLVKALQNDQRYRFIKAKEVYNNNLISNEFGATDFWETALQRPDWLLLELTSLLHPQKNVSLRWYRKL